MAMTRPRRGPERLRLAMVKQGSESQRLTENIRPIRPCDVYIRSRAQVFPEADPDFARATRARLQRR